MVDLYEFEKRRFQDLLKESEGYAFNRYGWTLFYSLPGEEIHNMKAKLGWKPLTALDHYNTGALLCRAGKLAQGLKSLEDAEAMGLDVPELFYNLALAYEKREEKKRAAAYFQKFIDAVEKENPIRPCRQRDLDEVRAHLKDL
jgi:tetratricopeptide (TPR) repeat protein